MHWFIRSVYERNLPKESQYDRFWGVSLVFNLFKAWPNNKHLSLKLLSYKVAVLLLLVTGHRGQTVGALSLDGLEIERAEAIFDLKTLLKSNRTGDPLSSLHVNAFRKDWKLCVVSALRANISLTRTL